MRHAVKPSIQLHLWCSNLFEFKGGIQVYLQDWLRVLTQSFPELNLIVLNKLDRSAPDQNWGSNLRIYCSGQVPGSLRLFHFLGSLFWLGLRDRPQLIVCGHLNYAPVLWLLHQITQTPYWILVYGLEAWTVRHPLKRRALERADRILSISQYTKNRLLSEQNLSPDRVALLPVTFDPTRFVIGSKPEALLQRYQLQPDQPIILTVTRLCYVDRYKGYDRILQVLPQIRQQLPRVHYLLVGQGDDLPRVQKLIQELDLETSVTLTGFVPDEELPEHYNLCDVFAMPSKGEGFGIVYLEALACGKPTLGGNQDGAIDALCGGELGALIDPDNLEALTQGLIQILQGTYPHPLMYQPEVLRKQIVERYGFDRFQSTLCNYIQDFLEQRTC